MKESGAPTVNNVQVTSSTISIGPLTTAGTYHIFCTVHPKKSSRWRPHLAALLTALVVSAGLLGLSSAPAWATAGTVTEFPLPQHGTPFDITAGPDGNLWFTGYSTGEVGRITPAGSITEFPTPNGAWGITAGPDGNVWFTEERVSQIGRISTS